jgi:hypothetical protein
MSDQLPQDPKTEGLSRRDALKALAAVTGAAVLASVPVKWETPLVEIGALPAHAQGSNAPIVISQFNGSWTDGTPPNCIVSGNFVFSDPLGQVTNGVTVNGTYTTSAYTAQTKVVNGTSSSGKLFFSFNSTICICNASFISTQVFVGARKSNLLNGTLLDGCG